MRDVWDGMTAQEQNEVLNELETAFRQVGIIDTVHAVDVLKSTWQRAELRVLRVLHQKSVPQPDVYAEVVP